jgi:hypothetical protein
MPESQFGQSEFSDLTTLVDTYPQFQEYLQKKGTTLDHFVETLDPGSKNALGLMVNLARYFSVDHNHEFKHQLSRIEEDAKKKDRFFKKYAVQGAGALEYLYRKKYLDFWLYVSQSGSKKDQFSNLERILDGYGIDNVVKDNEGIKLIQFGTREEDVEKKTRILKSFYGKYMGESNIIAVVGVLDSNKNILSVEDLANRTHSTLATTRSVVPRQR